MSNTWTYHAKAMKLELYQQTIMSDQHTTTRVENSYILRDYRLATTPATLG